jgi:hypothetical protein
MENIAGKSLNNLLVYQRISQKLALPLKGLAVQLKCRRFILYPSCPKTLIGHPETGSELDSR